ncbi:MAG: hypothetical protein KDH96_08190, partial [Candidatus Riesia sp.]|nr:hypothetical protein [Candidatus Riesia sp.]
SAISQAFPRPQPTDDPREPNIRGFISLNADTCTVDFTCITYNYHTKGPVRRHGISVDFNMTVTNDNEVKNHTVVPLDWLYHITMNMSQFKPNSEIYLDCRTPKRMSDEFVYLGDHECK